MSCNDHPTLHTPHIDTLAARGVNFTRAYYQSPVCGPSRMSFYTGRYMFCHGATWNNVPLSVGKWTMGDYLRPLGLRTVLVGVVFQKWRWSCLYHPSKGLAVDEQAHDESVPRGRWRQAHGRADQAGHAWAPRQGLTLAVLRGALAWRGRGRSAGTPGGAPRIARLWGVPTRFAQGLQRHHHRRWTPPTNRGYALASGGSAPKSATQRGAPPPGPRRASCVHAARWGASEAGIAPSHAPPRRAPQGAERLLALRPAAAGAIGEPQPALGPQGVLAAVALGASRRCAPWDALGTRPGRAADGEERPGPGLPARGYDDQAQGASNLSPSPLLKHCPRNLQAQPGTVGILRLEEGHRADVTIYDLKTLQPYPALTIRSAGEIPLA